MRDKRGGGLRKSEFSDTNHPSCPKPPFHSEQPSRTPPHPGGSVRDQ